MPNSKNLNKYQVVIVDDEQDIKELTYPLTDDKYILLEGEIYVK